jgi:hypothetical protein
MRRVSLGEALFLLGITCLYDHPTDYPDKFVARRSIIRNDGGGAVMTNDMFVGETLAEVRALLPRGLYCINRSEADDRVIVETWL